jgi:ribonuclease Z
LLIAGISILAVALGVWNSRAGQDWLLENLAAAAMKRPSTMSQFDGLKVFLCGTSSPLPEAGRAQACVTILAGESLFVVDAGAGSALTAALGRLPLENLEAVLLTHFHSDHIAALPEFNLNSWVAGRPRPLRVLGPTGVLDVVDGLNQAYRLDRSYRVAHHGEELLPAELGYMEAEEIAVDSVFTIGDVTITSFQVDHDPVTPAVGYRFDFRGRSVVVSGDAVVTDGLVDAASGADLLLQDALSLPIVSALEKAAAGSRMEKILYDIQDYHAHTADLSELVARSGVAQLAVYHMVPPPSNALFEKVFSRDLPPGTIITEDGMQIELPAGSEAVQVIFP